uniref:Uncharacterized protein n=1 Tax=Arundo donax TaxID=35708 RepID=A0A0A9FWQ4_ARUDO
MLSYPQFINFRWFAVRLDARNIVISFSCT